MNRLGGFGQKKWPRDFIFAVHAVVAAWNLLMGVGSGVRALLPVSANWLGAMGMIVTLAAWIPALLLSPVVIVVSLWHWRDWSVMLPAMLLGAYLFALQYIDAGQPFYLVAAGYTIVALVVCPRWFLVKRSIW